ncbi:response regulator [Rhodopseudomonas palustris]|uniref:response regulator n=1 Tax=Rhodopseudomonas palustris TaxID=1076 RepID=UPI002ACEDC38|nr:response regulator [Rhodopseudomonas palustris]WQH01805.1 response regulator [Rhodopseudomonas palustris]
MDHSIVVLVVEDDPMIQSVVQEALEEGGFDAVIASSGEEAVKLLDDLQRFRALLTDVNLGRDRMDGWDVGRFVREADPAFPVIYMTGDSAAEWAARGVPGSLLLTKPFAPSQVIAAVTQLLNNANPAVPPTA